MALNWLKKWLLESAEKKIAAAAAAQGKATSIGIMLEDADSESREAIYQYFEKKGVRRDELVFLLYLKDKPVEAPDCLYYHQKEVKWAGYAFNDQIASFLAHRFKRLYYLCANFDTHQQLILKNCQASFKTGIYTKDVEPWLDLTIDDNPGDCLAQIVVIDNWIEKISSHGK